MNDTNFCFKPLLIKNQKEQCYYIPAKYTFYISNFIPNYYPDESDTFATFEQCQIRCDDLNKKS